MTADQGALFVPIAHGLEVVPLRTPAARTDPPTSADAIPAAERLAAGIRDAVATLAAWRGIPPTSLELAAGDVDRRYLLARRLPDAAQLGLVVRGAIRECTVSGRRAVTWTVTPAGQTLLTRPVPSEA